MGIDINKRVTELIGEGVEKTDFFISLIDGIVLNSEKFNLLVTKGTSKNLNIEATWRNLHAKWQMKKSKGGSVVKLILSSCTPLKCKFIKSIVLDYNSGLENIESILCNENDYRISCTQIL